MQQGAITTSSASLPDFAGDLQIGIENGSGFPFNGWIDEFRWSNGIARDSTPPAQPYDTYSGFDLNGNDINTLIDGSRRVEIIGY